MNALLKARWILAGRTLLVGLVIGVTALAGGCTAKPPVPPVSSEPAWVISSAGIGPYKIGDPFEGQVVKEKRFGCAWVHPDSQGHGMVSIGDDSFGFQWDPTVTTPALRITRVEINVSGGELALPARTAEGVGPGSTRGEVTAAYPDAVPDKTGRWDELMITRDGVPIVFSFGLLSSDNKPATSDRVETVVVGHDTPMYEVCI